MKFIFLKYKTEEAYVENLAFEDTESIAIFVDDYWNDYGYYTLYHGYIYKPISNSWKALGKIKILAIGESGDCSSTNRELKRDKLYEVMLESLPNNYYSLGQSTSFYSNVQHYLGSDSDLFLSSIRDISTNVDLYEEIKETTGFKDSLIRENTAEYVINNSMMKHYQFIDFSFKNDFTEFKFIFSDSKYNSEPSVINRLNVMIGKNSVGKTHLLNNIAKLFSNSKEKLDYRLSPLKEESLKKFDSNYPTQWLGFSKYISISANAFDDFCTSRNNDFDISLTGNLLSIDYLLHKRKIDLMYKYEQIKHELEMTNKIYLLEKYKKESSTGINLIDEIIENFGCYDECTKNLKIIDDIKKYVKYCKEFELYSSINKPIADKINEYDSFFNTDLLLQKESSYCYIGIRAYNQLDSTYTLLFKLIDALQSIYSDEIKIGDEQLFRSDVYERILLELVFYKSTKVSMIFIEKLRTLVENYTRYTEETFLFKRCPNTLIYEFDMLFRSLSSGQSYMFYILTCLIKVITKGSLVIIDEPELHLHPNAISNFVKIMHWILSEFESYSIMCTHNPIIVQEVPRNKIIHVSKIIFNENTDNEVSFTESRPMLIETYANSIDTIVQEVFDVQSKESFFRESLNKLIQKNTPDEIYMMFDRNLSRHAYYYLLDLQNVKEKNE